MAAITTAATGNWNNTATWTGGVIPVAGDTVSFGGAHTVTVPAGYTAECGNAAAPTTASISNASNTGGVLIVNGTLRVRSNIVQNGATWQINAGGIVEAPNATSAIVWLQSNAALTMTGTNASTRAILRKGTGGAGLSLKADSDTFPFNNRLDATWSLFQGLGSASVFGLSVENLYGTDFGGGAGFIGLLMQDCVVDGCGTVGGAVWNIAGITTISLKRVRFKNSLASDYCFRQDGSSAATGGAVRLFEDCAFDKTVRILPPGFTFTRCIFATTTLPPVESSSQWAACTDTVFSNESSDPILYGPVTRMLSLRNVPAGENWHALQVGNPVGGNVTLDGIIFDSTVPTDNGDMISAGTGNAAGTVITIQKCIATKGPHSSGCYGKLGSMLGSANISYKYSHNTQFSSSGTEGAIVGIGETYAGFVGQVPEVKSNLAVGLTAGEGTLITRQGSGSGVTNIATPAGITNNAVRNARAADGAAGTGIGNQSTVSPSAVMFSPLPAAPLDVNPNFVDDTRNLATWYRSVVGGAAGTRTADMALAITALASAVETPVAGISITAAYTWIKAGFAPTNSALLAAHDADVGGWIGAVEGVTVGGGSLAAVLRRRRTI